MVEECMPYRFLLAVVYRIGLVARNLHKRVRFKEISMLAKATPVLPAEDMERAKAFYTEKVGLSILFEMPEGAAFGCGDGTTIFIYPHERTLATHTTASFVVENVVAEVARLREQGVVFEEYDDPELKTENGIAQQSSGSGAFFTDTEGNIIGIVQM